MYVCMCSLITTPNKGTKLGGSPFSKSPWGAQRNEEKETGRLFQVGKDKVLLLHVYTYMYNIA